MKKSLILTIVILIVIMGGVLVFVVGKNQKEGENLSTSHQTATFKPILGSSHTIANNQVKMKIGVTGADSSKGVSALALSFSNLPAYLSNPKISITESGWNTNQSNLEKGSIKFVANNVFKPIIKDVESFAEITFDVVGSSATVKNQKADVEIEIVDSSPKAKSHVFQQQIEILAK